MGTDSQGQCEELGEHGLMQTGGGFKPGRIQMDNPGFLRQMGHNYVIVFCTNRAYKVHKSPFLSCCPESMKQEYQADDTGKNK